MVDDWMPHARAFLEAENVDAGQTIQAARLALMLAHEGETAVVGVEIGDNRIAWCCTYSAGWSCVAIGADDGRRSMARDAFFTKGAWGTGWKRPGNLRRDMKRKEDAPFVQGGMAWCNHPDGGVHVARIAAVEPLTLELRPGEVVTADETSLAWRHFQHNAEGLEVEWLAGRFAFHNFRFVTMRAGLRMKHLRKRAEKVG